jgi:hypothetical protein
VDSRPARRRRPAFEHSRAGVDGTRDVGEERQLLQELRQRVDHLERLLEGLQDAIHRDSIRLEQRMAELERKTDPDVVAKALSEDARRRGI